MAREHRRTHASHRSLGYVGGRLLEVLLDRGRRSARWSATPSARTLPDAVAGDRGRRGVRRGPAEALDGVATSPTTSSTRWARGDGDFAERDRRAACNFGDAARAAGVERVIYLGGLDGRRVRPPAQPPRGRRAPRRARHGAGLRARGDDHRRWQHVLCDAALARRAPARDDHPALGRHPHPADRRRRHRRARSPTLAERERRRPRSSSAAPTC